MKTAGVESPRLRRGLPGALAFALAGAALLYGCVQRDVIAVVVGDVVIAPDNASLLQGDSLRFRATVTDPEGRPLPPVEVLWSTQTPGLVEVRPDGWVAAMEPGVASVEAVYRGVSGSASITVVPAPTIVVEPDSVVLYGEAGTPGPVPDTVPVRNGPGGSVENLVAEVSYPPGEPTDWLSAELLETTTPTGLVLTGATASLPTGSYLATVRLTSPDDDRGPFDVLVRLSLTGFTVTQTSDTTVVSEGALSDTLGVVLDSPPDTTVVVAVVSGTPTEITVSPDTLVFEPGTWDMPQEVVVTGVNDLRRDGDQSVSITLSVVADLSDDAFDPILPKVVAAINNDDDTGTFTIAETGGGTSVDEGGSTDDFTVVLDAQPLDTVVFGITAADTTEVLVTPATLVFAPAGWDTPQSVTVQGRDDDVLDGTQVSFVRVMVDPARSDPAFIAAGTDSVATTTTDDDQAGFSLSATDGGTVVSEAGTQDTVFVVLDAEPAEDVTLTVVPGDGGEVGAVTSPVTFAPAVWNVPQAIVITGGDDRALDGDQTTSVTVSVDAGASDDAFDDLPDQSFDVTTIDDDIAGLDIVETDGATVTDEGGTTPDSFTVALDAQPAGPVAIDLVSADETEVTVSPARLVFSAAAWDQPQTVTVTGVDERFDDGDRLVPVVLTIDTAATHPDYDGVTPDSVVVTNVDDDTAGFTLQQTDGGTLVTEAGSQDSVTVVLDARPIDNVVITLLSADTTEVTVAPSLLTFTTDNWDTPQPFVVTGVDDGEPDGNRFSVIAVGVSGALSDAAFGNVGDQTVQVTTINDDVVAVNVTPTSGLLTNENGGTATFTVVLGSIPGAAVAIDLSSSDPGEGVPSPTTLTFNANDWNVPQTVTVTGVDDAIDDGDQAYTILTTLTTTDPDYAAVDPADVAAVNADNDDAPTLSVDDVTITEGNAGTTNAVFTVVQSVGSTNTVTVDFATFDGTATDPADYAATNGTLTFLPGGPLSQTVTVQVNGDAIDEGASESFTLRLTGAVNATILDGTGVGTIIDDDGAPLLSVDDVVVAEGDAGTTPAVFTVTLSAASGQTVTVDFATANGTAVSGADYGAVAGTLTFAPGTGLTRTVTVDVNGDVLDEGAGEAFTLVLSNPVNAALLDPVGSATITDDDDAPALSIDDVTVVEGNGGSVGAVFTVSLSTPSGQTVRVDYATADGTATAGSDYTAASGTVTFAAGQVTQTLTVTVTGDALDDGVAETFDVVLTAPVNATIADGIGVGTITDDDDPPTLSIGDVTVTEGNAGTTNAQFIVTQSAPSALPVGVDFATADGTATVAGGDYVPSVGSLTFLPGGPLTQTVTVQVNGDAIDEGAGENFIVQLANPTNATIADGTGLGTITDDDGAPALSIGDVTVTEGDGAPVNAVLTVTQTAPSGLTTTVDFTTADGTAVAGNDYTTTTNTLTFAPGVTTQTITIPILGDVLDEGASEAFTVVLSNAVNATIADGIGVVTIADDDGAPGLSIDDVVVVEGDAPSTVDAVFTVTQAAVSGLTTTVNFATANGTATAGADYVAASGTLTFDPGETTNTVTVTVNGDDIDEGLAEAFTVVLSGAVNATIVDPSGTGTITDDDDAPELSIGDATITEGDAGTFDLVFTVTQSRASSQAVTVDFATADGTATAGQDYVAQTGTVTFAAGGSLTRSITVVVNGDELDEGVSEVFTVNLTNPVNATIGDGIAVGTITDDDAPPALSIDDVTVTEGAGGETVDAVFTVTMSGASSQTVSVDVATADGTATVADNDYDALNTTLDFAPGGPLTQTVTVVVNGDNVDEPGAAENFTVVLTNPVNGTIADGTGVGTIIDDEGTPALLMDDVTVVEGNAGTVDADFTVSLSAPTGQTVTVDFATADGSAAAGLDYVARTGTLTFLPGGPLAQTVTIQVNGDLIDEGVSESFTLNLTNANNATILSPSEDGIITDDDAATLSIDDVSVVEGDAGQVNAVFTVTKSLENSQTVTVDFATANGTATAPADYATTTGTTSFLAGGPLTQTITVPVNGDLIDEGAAETFTVNLSNPTSAAILDGVGVGTIIDDDDPPTLSIDDVTVTEGDAGTVDAIFTVTQSAASSQTVTVDFATAGGTATSGIDFTATNGTLTFVVGGPLTQTVTVEVLGDVLDEGAGEAFTVGLSNPVNATIADGTGIGTITDDDGAPTLTIDDVTVLEGNAGTVNAVFTVTQSAPSGQTVSVDYATADGSATAGTDYVATAGTLTFPAGGPLTRTITVIVTADLVDEPATETFSVVLSNPVNAAIAPGPGTGSITDDDDPPTVSIGDVTVTEGNAGPVTAQFTVTQSAASELATSVDFGTADGTATAAGGDYVPANGTLAFAPGGPLTRTISVTVNGDVVDEGVSEAFTVVLANGVNLTIADGVGVGTITDDDAPPVLSIDDVTVTEGNAGTVDAVFTVTRTGASSQTVSVNFATADGTATAGTDYVAANGTLNFAPGGPATQTVTVTVNGDAIDEGASEAFTVQLTGAVNATIGDASGTGTILDDDGAPTLTVNDVTVTEGDAGIVDAVFTVSQSVSSGQTVTVDFATADGTATAGLDYVARTGTLTFPAGGPLTQTVTISVTGDEIDEGVSENFTLQLTNPTNAAIGDDTGNATITDDDDAAFSINDVTIAEGDVGTTVATFTVSLSVPRAQAVAVDFATADGTATVADGDYVATNGTLNFAAGGPLTQTVTVTVNGDNVQEGPAETFTVVLTNAVNALIADGTGLGTIVDDDGAPALFVDDVTVVEGDAGTVAAVFTVAQSNGSAATVTVDFATADGTAAAATDYIATNGTLTFAPGGPLTQTVTVVVNGDLIDEGTAENFTLNLSNVVNAAILDGTGTGTITDDDQATLSIDDVTVLEGNAGTVNAQFTVTKSLASSQTVSVDFATADGTATAGADYLANNGTLDFDPGNPLTQTVTVVVNGDALDEGDAETFTVQLTNVVNAVILDGTGLGTITDDDDPPTLSVNDIAVTEGDAGTVAAVFTVTLSAASNRDVSVDFEAVSGTAVAGTDFVATTGTLTFLAGGPLTQTVTVLVNGDLLDEGAAETFTLVLSAPVNATILDGSGGGTILDDDAAPTVSIDDVAVTEGDVGTVNAQFTVTLSAPSGLTVTVDYATANGTATAGPDYTQATGTVTFTPGGSLTQTINVVVSGDLLDEGAAEVFTVVLTNAVNAGIADGTGTGTILDDDAAPTLSINDVTVTEGNAGTVNAQFTVTQSAASGQTVNVTYATADGSAAAGTDYQAGSATLTFVPGGPLTQTIDIVVNGDLVDEGSAETFTVVLSAPNNATIARGVGLGTILDDDGPPTLAIGDVTVLEGDAGTVNAVFTVTQSAASGLTVTVDFATADGTATLAGGDYAAAAGTVTIQPGDPLTQSVVVAVNGDLLDEGAAETFAVVLTNSTNATVTDGNGVGTITDDDDPPTLSIDDVTVVEGDGGQTNATFTVTMSETSGLPVGVSFTTADGTATLAGGDYAAASGTLAFPAGGPLTQTLVVAVNGDLLDEGAAETFNVVLASPTNATIADGTGVGTITDDDDPPTLSINDVTVTEGNTGTVNAVFTVTQSAASGLTVAVDFATADGTATIADADYVATAGTLTFAPGSPLTRTITVPVNGDAVDEGASEDFTVNLTAPVNATLADGTGIGTIIDDEGPPTIFTDDVTVVEGDVGTVDAIFTVSLSSASAQTITVDFATGDGTATVADGDYDANNGTLTFTPGNPLVQTVTVVVNGDLVDEGISETFTFDLTNPTNATIVDPSETGTITDDDTAALTIDDVTLLEGDIGSSVALFTVTKSVQSSQAVSVNYATADGTATTAGGDYDAASGTLLFLPGGALTQTVPVTVNGDVFDEGAFETFTVGLSGIVGATITDATGLGTITDDDGPPTISIGDVTVVEGDAGAVNAIFTVTQSAPSGLNTSVDFTTNDGTATVAGGDYNAAAGTVTFLAGGALTQTITVVVNGDVLDEGAAEAFTVDLSNPTNAVIGDGTGQGTITDDDDAPTVSVADVTVVEGNVGTVNADFLVTLSEPSGLTIDVSFTTVDGTATAADGDFVAQTGTVTFAPGVVTQTITVLVNGDLRDEGLVETFDVTLNTPVNTTIADGTATGTITDDDDPPTISIADAVATTEGGVGTTTDLDFVVSLSGPSGLPVSVDFTTNNGTATTGDNDYDALVGTLNFAPGEVTQTITVTVNGDALDEGASENFTVTLAAPVNGTIADGSGLGTIIDDDDPPAVSIADGAVIEGDVGTVDIDFVVTLDAPSGLAISVDFTTNDGTATVADNDYDALTGTVTFNPGVTSQTVTVTVNGDVRDEGLAEEFTVTLNTPVNTTIADGVGTGTINDDDDPPTVSIGDAGPVTEGDTGTIGAVFNVTLSAPSGLTVTVDFTTNDGSATVADGDFVAQVGTVTFAPGIVAQTVTVVVNGDQVDEGAAENFTVTLAAPVNATVADGSGDGTILDDDDAGITVGAISGPTAEAGPGAATFTVVLDSEPTNDVTIGVASNDLTEGVVTDPASGTLTFTAANWNTPQVVTVTGVDDPFADGDVLYAVVLDPAASADLNYDNLNPADVAVTNTDDENAGFTVTEVGGNTVTDEDGPDQGIDVVLDERPETDVVIDITEDDLDNSELTLSVTTMTFTTTNWNTPQRLTVSPLTDGITDGDQNVTITFSVNDAASPAVFGALVDQAVVATINDINEQ